MFVDTKSDKHKYLRNYIPLRTALSYSIISLIYLPPGLNVLSPLIGSYFHDLTLHWANFSLVVTKGCV